MEIVLSLAVLTTHIKYGTLIKSTLIKTDILGESFVEATR
jgi:hypothetical protein